jgi:hypothetical protein
MSRTEKKDSNEGLWVLFNSKDTDKIDTNLLNIEIDIHENCFSESNDDEWGLHDEEDVECPRTPPSSAMVSRAIHQITPNHVETTTVVEPQNLLELRIKYQKCFRKLANSMRQTDLTRGIVKRQRTDNSFFSSSKLAELETSRRNLYKWINSTVHCSP